MRTFSHNGRTTTHHHGHVIDIVRVGGSIHSLIVHANEPGQNADKIAGIYRSFIMASSFATLFEPGEWLTEYSRKYVVRKG